MLPPLRQMLEMGAAQPMGQESCSADGSGLEQDLGGGGRRCSLSLSLSHALPLTCILLLFLFP